MTEKSLEIKDLLARLEELSKKQLDLQRDVSKQQDEINKIKIELRRQDDLAEADSQVSGHEQEEAAVASPENIRQRVVTIRDSEDSGKVQDKPGKKWLTKVDSLNLEEFIGGNLINKIGIMVLIIGVGIGVKYAIDHDLISPLMRIILGYMVGVGLLVFGIRLKKQYENFSAVLMSGSMAIFYFISYAFHAYYEIIPQWLAFGLMVVITIVTIYTALHYNRQVIAHIGLVGAYTIPFIFNETNTRPEIFFPYMAIITGGILILSILKQWKALFYASFSVTWLIFMTWFVVSYDPHEHFTLSAVILPIFFMTFNIIFLVNKLIEKDKLNVGQILVLLLNTILFFTFGLYILDLNDAGKDLLGAFTILIAAIHAGAFIILTNRRFPDRILRLLILGLAILFLTIAIPIGLEGNWMTLAWLVEGLILFSIGRLRKSIFTEYLSYVVIFTTAWSLLYGWINRVIESSEADPDLALPFLNFDFLTAVLAIMIFTLIFRLYNNHRYREHINPKDVSIEIFNTLLPVILIGVVYMAFRMEIGAYFNIWSLSTKIDLSALPDIPDKYQYKDYDITCFKSISLMIYTMVFVTLLSFLNIGKIKSSNLGNINLVFNGLVLLVVIPLGFYLLGILRDSYINQTLSDYYSRGSFHIIIRYIYIAFIGLLLSVSYKYVRQKFLENDFRITLDIVLYTSILVIASTELIQWLDFSRVDESYKLELSIMWGLYAVMLIIVGIWKKQKHLRIGAIVLFSGTLLKLFIYDIAHLDTISKTVVFIVLGILLLITSFLYLKYRNVLFGSDAKEKIS
ncbi:MAG: hypothetical protein AMS26_15055 [Bacteroides sp. SM23_62]|nr:MAG: hypothetical protein AMS26_15055 [Bacteroides sp. SM23_62]